MLTGGHLFFQPERPYQENSVKLSVPLCFVSVAAAFLEPGVYLPARLPLAKSPRQEIWITRQTSTQTFGGK